MEISFFKEKRRNLGSAFLLKNIFCLSIIILSLISGVVVSKERESIISDRVVVSFYVADSNLAQLLIREFANALQEQEHFFGFVYQDTVKIYLENSISAFKSRSGAYIPDWGLAVAVPGENAMILKSPSVADHEQYLFQPYEIILRHELSHLFLFRALSESGETVPVWFNEGIAMLLSKESRPYHVLPKAILSDNLLDLDDIDYVLRFDPIRAQLAYEQSHSAIGFLIMVAGEDVINKILKTIRTGKNFNEAFTHSTGINVYEFEKKWRDRVSGQSGITIWLQYADDFLWVVIIPIILLLSWMGMRYRRKNIERSWEEDEDA